MLTGFDFDKEPSRSQKITFVNDSSIIAINQFADIKIRNTESENPSK